MRMTAGGLLAAMALAGPALAQPASPAGSADCQAEQTAIERDMDLARAKGQMLRRRQLAETLAALQERCKAPPPEPESRAARIERLEQEILELQQKMDQAQAQLRALQDEAP